MSGRMPGGTPPAGRDQARSTAAACLRRAPCRCKDDFETWILWMTDVVDNDTGTTW